MRRVVILVLALTLLVFGAAPALGDSAHNFSTHLKGRNEVPPIGPVDTNAQGQALIRIAGDETSIDFKLIVANIDNVTQAHIHCGGPDANGPVVAFLFGLADPAVTVNGVLSTGTITAFEVIARPDSPACPGGVADLADLIDKIRSGGAYVNVHTVENPGGEIRGQL